MPVFDCDFEIALEPAPDPAGGVEVRLRHWSPGEGQADEAGRGLLAVGTCDGFDPAGLDRRYLQALRKHVTAPVSPDLLQGLGRELGRILLPAGVRSTVLALSAAAGDPVSPVRLRLSICAPELAGLPWEYVWLDDRDASGHPIGFLTLHPRFSLIRQVSAQGGARHRNRTAPSDRLHLLAACADPRSSRHPALPHLASELKVIESLDQVPECRTFDARQLRYTTSANLKRYLTESPPHVLHFIGHGDRMLGEGVLILEGGGPGVEERLRASELAEWLRDKPTRLVVLSACWSGTALNGVAQAIASMGTAAVVAMQMPFSDAAAGPFARAFYSALAQFCSVEEALNQARQMIKGAGADWGIPVLYTSGDLAPVAERPAATTPVSIPYPRDPHFVGRERQLAELHGQLNAPGWRSVALVAMGGAGKTEIATEYAHTRVADYPGGVFWLNARDASVLTEEYASLSRFFDLPEDMPLETRAARVRDRLDAAPLPTLLIFDNLADVNTRELLPTRGGCRVLITTREEWLVRNRAHVHFVPVLDEEAALKILQADRPIDPIRAPAELEAARGVAAMVGNLPLALALAGQHVRRLSLSFQQYQEILSANRREVLERARRDFIASTEHRGQIFDTIDIACRSLDATASRVLATAACLGGGSFATELLKRACSDIGPLDLAEAIAALLDRCLLMGEPEGRLTLHELVCLVAEGNISDTERPEILTRTAAGLAGMLGEANDVQDWRPVRPDMGHFRAVAASCSELLKRVGNGALTLACADLHCQLGRYQFEEGRPEEADGLLCRCLSLLDSRGSGDTDSLRLRIQALRSLGGLREHCGIGNGLSLARDALRLARRNLAQCDPEVFQSLTFVGQALFYRGQYLRALPYDARSLSLCRQAYAGPHPAVAMCLNNLGTLYQALGESEMALEHIGQALALDREMLGNEHPKVAIRLNNIGRILREQGQWQEALGRHEEALRIYSSAHGPDHPDVAASLLLSAEALLCTASEENAVRARRNALDADRILEGHFRDEHRLRRWARSVLQCIDER